MSQLTLTEAPKRLSRDEMNLAEFPLSVLSTRVDSKVKTLEFRDSIIGKNGEVYNRDWIVTGADKFGLPTASDDEVLLGLLKLTVSDGFRERKVYFTRYELLKILRWTTEGRSYSRLQSALDRLSGVRIKATNAFYDNENKAHVTRNFGIIDAYEITDGRDAKPSFFTWSDVLYKSFQAGFIKKFDLDFCLGLKSAVSKRLYRFLDKHFWYKPRIRLNLFTLAHEKIGISRNCKYASSIRQQLDPALEELQKNGFISDFSYEGKGQGTEITIAVATGKPRMVAKSEGKTNVEIELPQQVVEQARKPISEELLESLVARGIRQPQAERLLNNKSEVALERVKLIIEYFDRLVASGSRLVSKSPVGFLYRAVERPDTFSLPGESDARNSQSTLPFMKAGEAKYGARGGSALRATNKPAESDREGEYLTYRKREIDRLRENTEQELLTRMTAEVEKSLQTVRGSLSASGFELAVRHGVDEKLARLFDIPSFTDWLASLTSRRAAAN